MAKRRSFKDRVRIGQTLERKSGSGNPDLDRATIYQVWRKSMQVQIKYTHGGKAIMALPALEKYWHCSEWYVYDPTA